MTLFIIGLIILAFGLGVRVGLSGSKEANAAAITSVILESTLTDAKIGAWAKRWAPVLRKADGSDVTIQGLKQAAWEMVGK